MTTFLLIYLLVGFFLSVAFLFFISREYGSLGWRIQFAPMLLICLVIMLLWPAVIGIWLIVR